RQLQANVPDRHMREELAAYAVETFVESPPSVKKWVSSIVGAVKDLVFRGIGIQLGMASPSQFTAFVTSCLRSSGKKLAENEDNGREKEHSESTHTFRHRQTAA